MTDPQDKYDEAVLAPLRARLVTEENRSRYAEEQLAAARARIAQLEAEAFKLRRLADGMAEALRPFANRAQNPNAVVYATDDGSALAALSAYAAHIAQGAKP